MQEKKTDRMVEIARFYDPEKARMLASFLNSEGIGCYLRNEYTSQVMYPADMGGIRVELLESDAPRARSLMQANGYGDESPAAETAPASARENRTPPDGGMSPGKRGVVLVVILLVCACLLAFCTHLVLSL